MGLILSLTSCNDAKYDTIANRAYLSESGLESFKLKKIMIDDEGGKFSVTSRLSQPAQQKIQIEYDYSKIALDEFNKRTGLQYEILPQEFVEFESKTTEIHIGEISSSLMNIKVKPLSDELINSGKKFAIPVKMNTIDNSVQTLKGSDAVVFGLEQVITTSVPIVNSGNNIKMQMRQDYALTEWSVEFRLNINKLGENIGELNNQAIFCAFAPDGMDGEIYSRFGDAPIKGNIFQVKNQGTQVNSNLEFEEKTWYHIAMVNDGSKITIYINGQADASVDSPGKITNLSKDKFQIGNMDFLKANVLMSEVRFWTKAISKSQIQNNMFAIDPQSEGLEAYWKLNEAEGNTFKDATDHGNDATSVGETEWIHNVRSDESKIEADF